MAEEENKDKKKPSILQRIFRKSAIKGAARRTGVPVRNIVEDWENIRALPTYIELDNELDFEKIGKLNNLMVETEARWDSIEKDDPRAKDSAAFARDQVVDLYCFDGSIEEKGKSEMNDCIGPFTDLTALHLQGGCAAYTKGIRKLPIKLDLNIGGIKKEVIEDEFSVPKKTEIKWPEKIVKDGQLQNRSYFVSYFGARVNPSPKPGYVDYWSAITTDVDRICDEVKTKYLEALEDPNILNTIRSRYKDETFTDEELRQRIKEEIETNIDQIIRKSIHEILSAVAEYFKTYEDEIRGELIGTSGIQGKYNQLKEKMQKINNMILTHEYVHYPHTYYVINENYVEVEKIGEADGVDINAEKGVVTFSENVGEGWKKPNEVAPGLDENGWPLEVVGPDRNYIFFEEQNESKKDGKSEKEIKLTKFVRREYPPGTVLLDIFENEEYYKNGKTPPNEPRVVPLQFITELDPLTKSILIDVHYDAYRDDLRDGRHHSKSLTVMEKIMTDIAGNDKSFGRSKDYKHDQSQQDLVEGKHAVAKIYSNIESIGPNKIKKPMISKFSPTPFNPAFDMRVLKKHGEEFRTIHQGRKLYYQTQSYTDKSDKPTITTRGASMYILHRFIDSVKYWDHIERGLRAVGEKTEGFDIGPNLYRWGKQLSKNPFRPYS